jgi:lysophospholipase L1-like esterase
MFQKITAAEVSKIVGRPEVMYYVVNADSTITHYKWDGTQMVPALSASAVAAVNQSQSFRRVTTPLRVATFGDSTANVGTANHDLRTVTAAFPGSGATVLSISADKFLLDSVYEQCYLVGNGGVSGETTAQMLARSAAGASSTRKAIEDIADLAPDLILLRGGSINDLTSLTAGTMAAQVATTYANHVNIINRLRSVAPVIDEGIYGYSGVGATDAAVTRQALLQLNTMFAAYAQGAANGVYFLPALGLLSDSTGAYLTGMSTDGTHLNLAGAKVLADAEADLVKFIFGPASHGPRYIGANLVTNPLMTQVGSQAYGTVATGFAIGASNATRQNAKVEVIDAKYWQTCEFVPTTSAPQGIVYAPYTPGTCGLLSTDVIGAEFDFLIQSLDGSPLSPASLTGRLDTTKVGRVVLDGLATSVSATFSGTIMKGRVIFPPWLIGEASATLTAGSFLVQLTGQDTRSFKLGMSTPRIVKL